MSKRLILLLAALLPMVASAGLQVVIIEGLPGAPEYAERFATEVEALRRAAESVAGAESVAVYRGEQARRDALIQSLATLGRSQADDRLALFLVGHGSFDGVQYKFNLPGPDLTDEDLSALLANLPTQRQLVVNTSSASGATVDRLKSDSRILITATRSGRERNAPYFGTWFAEALGDPAADTNKNDVISAAEAYEYAVRKVEDFFAYEGRLPTEHAVLEGSDAAGFALAKFDIAEPPRDNPELVRLAGQRDEVNARIEALQLRRDELSTAAYFDALQPLMIELALIEDEIARLDREQSDAP